MDIRISAAAQNNLMALKETSMLAQRTQERLATGLAVNSPLDNPNAYFQARALDDRASDLGNLLQDMGQAIQTIKAATNGLDTIEGLLDDAKAKASQASASNVDAERETYRAAFESLMTQIEQVAKDSGYKGVNLLANTSGTSGESLAVQFNETNTSNITVTGADYDDTAQTGTGNIGIGATVADDWTVANDANIQTALTQVSTALSTVRSQSSSFATSANIIQSRVDFTQESIANLTEGSGKLVLADMNQESANLLALQTRQQLGTTALSLTSQAEQGVLRLF